MKKEIAAVVTFLSRLIKNNENLNKEEIERFSDELTRLLYAKFANHWYPATPTKGQAYRCIRVNKFQGVDPDLLSACMNSGLVYEDLGLPKEFTLWVDPWEVCCRYGEKNHAFIVASIESDYNDKEVIPERESYVVDKVTSDYHSGSSSDDEIYTSNQKVLPISLVTNTSQNYQKRDTLFEEAVQELLDKAVLEPGPPQERALGFYANLFVVSKNFGSGGSELLCVPVAVLNFRAEMIVDAGLSAQQTDCSEYLGGPSVRLGNTEDTVSSQELVSDYSLGKEGEIVEEAGLFNIYQD
ncbi:protein BTG3 [Rhinophrynus dorsalis]